MSAINVLSLGNYTLVQSKKGINFFQKSQIPFLKSNHVLKNKEAGVSIGTRNISISLDLNPLKTH